MKKLIVMLFALVAVLCMVVTVGAEEAVPSEPVAEVSSTAEVTGTETVPEEVAELLATATPEQIEEVKQYILLGLDEMDKLEITGWEKVKVFVLEHLESIAWVVAAAAFSVFYLGNRSNKRKFTEGVMVMRDCSADMVEEMRRRSLKICAESEKNVADMMEQSRQDSEAVREETRAYVEEAKAYMGAAVEKMEAISQGCTEIGRVSGQEIDSLKNRETAAAEALEMLAEEINALLQLANLPEWKRDELQVAFEKAKHKVEEVKPHAEGPEGEKS